MKISLFLTGKTDEDYIKEGMRLYEKKIQKYLPFEIIVIPSIKNSGALSIAEQKQKEGIKIMEAIQSGSYIVLLDEKGEQPGSVDFSAWIQKKMTGSIKHLVFVIGGPYGFSEQAYRHASYKLSLSRMTFPHQLVRIIFMEQLYRAMTIIKREPYHHAG